LKGAIDSIVGRDYPRPRGAEIGRSREGRPILAYTIGSGPLRVSLTLEGRWGGGVLLAVAPAI